MCFPQTSTGACAAPHGDFMLDKCGRNIMQKSDQILIDALLVPADPIKTLAERERGRDRCGMHTSTEQETGLFKDLY